MTRSQRSLLIWLGMLCTAAACVLALCALGGCGTLSYYAQSITGHLDLVSRARPVSQWLDDEQTPEALKERLRLSQALREFAIQRLALPDNDSYRRYADLDRSAAVWNVVVAPELSLRLKTWCFPVMGCVSYRGYFHQKEAQAHAEFWKQQGQEVTVYGVPAYSTLGRLPGLLSSDPLLNTFIRYPEGELARMIFHELSHQVAYAANDTMFNESFATAVERIGSAMWLGERATPQARLEYDQFNARRDDFRALTGRYRERLQSLYESDASNDDKRAGKAALMAEMRAQHETLKRERWEGYAGYDGWFNRANNASLGVLSAYNELVPRFEQLFERMGRDFPAFYKEVRRIAELSTPQARRQALGEN